MGSTILTCAGAGPLTGASTGQGNICPLTPGQVPATAMGLLHLLFSASTSGFQRFKSGPLGPGMEAWMQVWRLGGNCWIQAALPFPDCPTSRNVLLCPVPSSPHPVKPLHLLNSASAWAAYWMSSLAQLGQCRQLDFGLTLLGPMIDSGTGECVNHNTVCKQGTSQYDK